MSTPAGDIPLRSLNWGDLRRMEPVSNRWGFDRGLPVDRHYIEAFLGANAADIRGTCIEVMNSDYIRRFGGDTVTHADVVDINPKNAKANIVGDLTNPATLMSGHYDCFVLTQTLPVIYDGRALIANCYASLKPGGVMLVTAPALCRYSPHPEDFWRLTDKSLTRLIADNTDGIELVVGMHGNLVASIAFMTGLACQDLTLEELELRDERFPVLVTARVRKPMAD